MAAFVRMVLGLWVVWLALVGGVLLPRLDADLGTLVLVGDFGDNGNIDIYTYDITDRVLAPLLQSQADFGGRYIVDAACPVGSSKVYFTGSGLDSIDRETGEIRNHAAVFGTGAITVHPDGDALMLVGQDDETVSSARDLFRYDIPTNTITPLLRDENNKRTPSWNADGTTVAYLSSRVGSRVQSILVQTGDDPPTAIYDNPVFPVARIAWSPLEDRLAYVHLMVTRWVVMTVDADGNNHRRLMTTGVTNASLLWSPDGRYLFYNLTRNQIGVRDMRVGATAPLATLGETVRVGCWLPPGA